MHEIGKLFDRPHTSIHTILSATGGIRPPSRHRSRLALTMSERRDLPSIGCWRIDSLHRQALAASCLHHQSRELLRNDGRTCYRAAKADAVAWERARRPKACKLACNPALAQIVAVKLQGLWSSEQIAGWLKRTYPGQKELQVSHEAIYRTLCVQTRGALKKELLEHLQRTRGMHRSRHYTQKTPIHGRIAGAVPISERPACIEDRAVPGHWEGDLLFGDAYSQVATLVERHTRYVMLVKLVDKDSYTVGAALARHAQTLPRQLYLSLTWD